MCAFKFFDKNDNGYIEEKEIKEILRKLGDNTTDEQIKQMIECADVDRDGRINYAGKVSVTRRYLYRYLYDNTPM